MNNPLAIYLHDHLAGSAYALDLLDSMCDHHQGKPLGELASSLVIELQRDRESLQQIVDHVGTGAPNLKEAVAWVAEKASRFKLNHDDTTGFGTFQALETLALGILGKISLWRALKVIAETDDRLRGVNFEELISRAETQYEQVEDRRLASAHDVF